MKFTTDDYTAKTTRTQHHILLTVRLGRCKRWQYLCSLQDLQDLLKYSSNTHLTLDGYIRGKMQIVCPQNLSEDLPTQDACLIERLIDMQRYAIEHELKSLNEYLCSTTAHTQTTPSKKLTTESWM